MRVYLCSGAFTPNTKLGTNARRAAKGPEVEETMKPAAAESATEEKTE
jgi:hypothetical protein